ncbi:DUF2243 domain-containing protein [Caldimonas brevitalea]|uniref:DUF2243 domain-containing protein n=1 Tax=Caldimonas brevitalea TaxID=413882 RepID=A0A0G3BFI2_9BURK|nr:DUF2243 domain-containing protein [Caldimonas brevitalea]AKJ28077.1 hypothetical protein AAW51_1386 [Caldimonas brevitalea]
MTASSTTAADPVGRGALPWGAGLLGFALGGFFDGILLHQVLQWHHLLSGIEANDGPLDLRTQLLADGLFHAAMYVVAVAGLFLLLRHRARLGAPGAGRRLMADALLGFGIWHVVDAVLSHWTLGLHRIRMGVDNPWLWDLGWLLVFGLGALVAAWALRRRPPARSGGGPATATLLVLLAAGAAAWATRAPAGAPATVTVLLSPGAAAWATRAPAGAPATVTVLLSPGAPPAAGWRQAERLSASVLWVDARGSVWVLALPTGQRTPASAMATGMSWRDGVLLVGSSWSAAACLGWSRGGEPQRARGGLQRSA